MSEYIGVYRLESPLGRGGMGEVFLAWDERLQRRVAIKRVRRDVFEASHHRDRFRREARMAARLSHPAIVQIHDLVADDSGDALVMEYVEGATLAQRMARGLLDAVEAVRLAREIAEGLAAAHAAGLIHRDLKAENVIVTPAGHAKILDFGLARPVGSEDERLTRHGAVVGTSYAMSPEQASGEELDARSDLFSFGALLYEMLTGRSPFRGQNSLNTLKRVLTEQPPPLASVRPDLPPGLASLVDRLLAKDRHERPASAEQVALRLERIERELLLREEGVPEAEGTICDQPTAAFPVVPWTRPSAAVPEASARRVRRRVLLLAALLLVAAGMASLLLARHVPDPEPEPKPIRVLVARPDSDPEDPRLALTTSGLVDSMLSGLAVLEGIMSLDPAIVRGPADSPLQAAQSVGADEVLVSEIVREAGMARVSIRRLNADGEVLWRDSWDVPTGKGGLPLLKETVGSRLREAYSDFPPRPGAPPPLQVRDEDYSAYLEIRERIDSGKPTLAQDLDQIDRIVSGSPRFLEGWIQGANLARTQFGSTRDPADLERARSYVERARGIDPDDLRTLRESFNIAIYAGDTEQAEKILSRMEERIAGDPELLLLRSRLRVGQRRFEEAGEALRAAVDRAPSWRHVYYLAAFEIERGRVAEARTLISELLSQSPDNTWARAQLAYIELTSGDLQTARQIYEELARADPKPTYFTNIGQALVFEKRYPEARMAYQRALDQSPGYITATLNFAEVEMSLGNPPAAQALYSSALGALEDNERAFPLTPDDLLRKAHCLAHLDRADEAREAVRLALRQQPDDPHSLWEASQVHAVLGDRKDSAAYAKSALDRGLSPHWFSVADFDEVRKDPSFQASLGSSGR